MATFDQLLEKIKILSEEVWEDRADWPAVRAWLDNFSDTHVGEVSRQREHALFLLSQFMYYGSREMRELLRSVFRDLYRYPIIENIRRLAHDTTDADFLNQEFRKELAKTRFLGVGNPSESGTHLLYYFRQENGLSSDLFLHAHQVFERMGTAGSPVLRNRAVTRYVFLDDFCGSGTQATKYSREIVEDIKRLDANAKAAYLVLFATTSGLEAVRANTSFDLVRAVFELDDSFRCFENASRHFRNNPNDIDQKFAEGMCRHYGTQLLPAHPLGFLNGQLLLGFFHNTPDNTLPVIWYSEPGTPWVPIFRRYPKLYDWGGT